MTKLVQLAVKLVGKQEIREGLPRGFCGMVVADKENAAVVTLVLADSPADHAGLKVGDRLTHFDDKVVRCLADIHGQVSRLTSGKDIKLTVDRNGTRVTLYVTLGEGL